MSQPVDKSILQEIVRIIESRRKVPEKVVVRSREYLITYLEDHMNRLDEALRRYDSDRLNMLYGQLASKVKYQMHRMVAGRVKEAAKPERPAKESGAARKEPKARAAKVVAKPAAKVAAKKVTPAAKVGKAKAAAKKAARKPSAKTSPRSAAKKTGRAPAVKKAKPAKKGVAAKKTTRAAAKKHK